MALKRIALCLHYDGSAYHGWQVQKGLSTVQAAVERALSVVANHPVNIFCAGRTDAGVHATAQVIHFDTDAERSERAWVFGSNGNLPPDISVQWAREVSENFHARFSAQARRYRYVLYNHPVRPAILRKSVGWWYRSLDAEKMHSAAQYLLGEHDFSSFRGSGCQAHSPKRTITQISVQREQEMIIVDVQANAFLLHMVRNIVGVLATIGEGAKSPQWILEVLESCDRRQAGMTATPTGLYFVGVDYPAEFKLPQVPLGPFFLPFLL